MLHRQNLEQPGPVEKSVRVIKIFLAASTLLLVIYGYLAVFQADLWQVSVIIGVILGFVLVLLASFVLIRQGRPNLGMWLLIFALYVCISASSVLLGGYGLLFGVSLVMLIVVVATETLPRTQAVWAIIGGVVVGSAIWLLDFTYDAYQLDIPELRPIIVAVSTLILLLMIYAITRQFNDYSLRAKLIVGFLAVSVLSVFSVAVFSISTTSAALTAEVGGNLKNLANSQALNIGTLLARQVDVLRSVGLDGAVRERLKLFNSIYSNDPDQIEARLAGLEEAWQQNLVNGDGPLIRARLNNNVANIFSQFQTEFPNNIELLVTDKYGGLVAATALIPHYDETDEEWWQQTYNNGLGAIYISQPQIDEHSGSYGIIIGVPIYDGGALIGVLHSQLDIASLVKLVSNQDDPAAGIQSFLLFPSGQMLTAGAQFLTQTPPEILEGGTTLKRVPFAEYIIAGEPQLASQSDVQSITGEALIDRLGWVVLSLHNRDVALAPVDLQRRNIFLLAAFIGAIVVSGAALLSNQIAGPLIHLAEVAQRLAGGDLNSRANVKSGDEVGLLAANFNAMAGQLSENIDSLEHRVDGRTKQLITLVDVTQRLSAILDLSDLMRQVVTLTKETFNYYHVHIYLLDQQQETLILAEGYGQAGAEMKRRGHSIPVNAPRSLVARSAREGHMVTVENVRTDTAWLPNALLPSTYSEAAVPVLLGSEVVGVLDVQSEHIGGITAEDEIVLQALASQVAVAVRNARLFSETQDALYQAQKLQDMYTGQAWQQFAAAQTSEFEIRRANLPPLENIPTPEVTAALESKQTIDLNLKNSKGSNGFEPAPDLSEPKTLATPLKLRGQVIGVLGIRDEDPDRRWTADEIALIEAVSEQMSLAIENARLFDETGRRAGREKIIADVTQQIWASGEMEKVMQTAVEQIGTRLDASKVVIRLGTANEFLSKKLTRGEKGSET
jgi:GAF domain-containing protein/HAMP domain-containing protein